MKLKPQTRSAQIDATRIDAELRTLELSFSSESPVDRYFGMEVLDHSPKAARMERLNNRAPLLFNHNLDDVIGVVEGARIGNDKRGHAQVRFAKTARADEVFGMVRDGILPNVSFGYRIHEADEDPKTREFRVTDWEPLEISIVTVPADPSVGVGRAFGDEETEVAVRSISPPAAPAAHSERPQMADNQATAGANAEVQVIDNGMQERLRITTITRLSSQHKIADEQRDAWVHEGKSAEDVAQAILDVIAERAKRNIKDNPSNIGLSPAEARQFSITRAISAVLNKDWSKAQFEADVSRSVAQRMGRQINEFSFLVPMEVQQRTLQVGTSAQGGYAVGTGIYPGSFVDLLRNRSVVMRLGARTMSGLVGNVAIPKQATGGSVAWLGELGTATASELTLGQLTLSPKTVGGFQQISRQLLLQSTPDAEALVNADLAAAIALGVDTAALAGTSTDSTQPLGIRYTSGLGTANPTSGTAVNYADMIKFQTTVAASNAMFPSFAYVCHPAIAGLLMGKPRFTNSDTPIWGGTVLDGQMVGARAMSSLQVTSGTMLAGDFSQVIIGEWGTLEVEVNPYQNFQAGIVGVRGMYTVDVGVRYGAAFAIGTGITG